MTRNEAQIEAREVDDVRGVILQDANCGDRLFIEQCARERLEIEGHSTLLPRIESSVRDGLLTLRIQGPWLNRLAHKLSSSLSASPIIYRLQVRDLQALQVFGWAWVRIPSLRTQSLDVKVSGAAQVQIEGLQVRHLKVRQYGAGSLHLSGTVADQEVYLSGPGRYDGRAMRSERCILRLLGAGDVGVWAVRDLDVIVRGAGSVIYRGEPRIRQGIYGSGSVRQG